MKVKKQIAGILGALLIGTAAICAGAAMANQPAANAADAGTEQTNTAVGGWEVTDGAQDISKHADAKNAFDKATESLLGVDYTAFALLGTQTVAGTNYCILAKAVPVYPDAEASYALVYVYEDLDGNAEVTNIVGVDIAALADAEGDVGESA